MNSLGSASLRFAGRVGTRRFATKVALSDSGLRRASALLAGFGENETIACTTSESELSEVLFKRLVDK
jgi:hypothetical protein